MFPQIDMHHAIRVGIIVIAFGLVLLAITYLFSFLLPLVAIAVLWSFFIYSTVGTRRE